jgi:predicted hotdog family 3-hydroxylacyl-ACP dehydratase
VSFPPISVLLPHRGSAIWLDRVLEASPTGCSCAGRLPGWTAGLSPSSCYGIELVAQAAAAFAGLHQGRPEQGYVASVRSASLYKESLPVQVELEVRVRPGEALGRGRVFLGEVRRDAELLLACELLVVQV